MLPGLIFMLLAAQEPPPPQIRTTVALVLAPVMVTDRDGKPVAGLTHQDFQVLDGGKPRAHQLEVETQPVAVVVAIQTNSTAGPALAKIVKTGSMFLPMVAGEGGSVAVLAFSDRVQLRQDFTSKPETLVSAFRNLRPGGDGACLLDAIGQGLEMLARRNRSERRVLILIGESRDRTSESKLPEVLAEAIASNVTIYSVSFSVYLTSFTSRGSERFGEKERRRDAGVSGWRFQPACGVRGTGKAGEDQYC
jgi:VWFA-related protein